MIAIIDGCGTNIASVQFALQRLGADSQLTTDPAVIQSASHIILPGVGAAGKAMQQLKNKQLIELIQGLQQPVLGICLGMQLLFEFSEEDQTHCLDIIPERVVALPATDSIPHMGWNQLQIINTQHPLLQGIKEKSHVYFVHSFAAPIGTYTLASSQYTMPFSAIINYNNFYGAQFHPERSGKVGAKLLENFLSI